MKRAFRQLLAASLPAVVTVALLSGCNSGPKVDETTAAPPPGPNARPDPVGVKKRLPGAMNKQ